MTGFLIGVAYLWLIALTWFAWRLSVALKYYGLTIEMVAEVVSRRR